MGVGDGRKFSLAEKVLGLVAAVFVLAAAVVGFLKAAQDDPLETASVVEPDVWMTSPRSGAEVPVNVTACAVGKIPAGSQVRFWVQSVLAQRFYDQGPAAEEDGRFCREVFVGTAQSPSGEAFLVIPVVADAAVASELDREVERSRATGSWPGRVEPPPGVSFPGVRVTRVQ